MYNVWHTLNIRLYLVVGKSFKILLIVTIPGEHFGGLKQQSILPVVLSTQNAAIRNWRYQLPLEQQTMQYFFL